MSVHSLYFLGYAVLATAITIVMASAQYTRYKREGVQFNWTMLAVVGGVALAMWTGAALTEFAYKTSTTTAGAAAFFLGIIFSAFFAWQLNAVMNKILSDERTIYQLSTHDAITGLRNRRFFSETLNTQVKEAVKEGKPLSLMMLDIDDLAQINEAYSWTSGDMILKELGARLQDAQRSTDYACSFGADKTATILTETDSEAAREFAKKLSSMMGKTPFKIENDQSLDLTFNIGLATLSERTHAGIDLVREALAAQDVAKEKGGNCCYMYIAEDDIQEV